MDGIETARGWRVQGKGAALSATKERKGSASSDAIGGEGMGAWWLRRFDRGG